MIQVEPSLAIRARAYCASGRARCIRETSRLTLREVADLVGGVTPPAVHYWETGQRVPRGEVAVRYGRVLLDLERFAEELA